MQKIKLVSSVSLVHLKYIGSRFISLSFNRDTSQLGKVTLSCLVKVFIKCLCYPMSSKLLFPIIKARNICPVSV